MTAQQCSGLALPVKGSAPRPAPAHYRFAPTVLLTGMALLCGCASYSPQPLDPFAELKKLEQRAAAQPEDAISLPAGSGWIALEARIDFSDGLDLAEANTLALYYSPEIRAARNEQQVSAAQLLQAGLLANPELFLGPRISSSGSGLVFPAGISWELPLWGRRAAEKELAERSLTAAGARLAEKELKVLTRIRSAYIRIETLAAKTEALQARTAGSQGVLRWADRLKQAGQLDGVTSWLARLEYDEALADLKALQLELATEKRKLQESLGLLPNAEMLIQLDPSPSEMPVLPPLNRQGMMRHPRITSASREYDKADAALRLEVTGQYPAVRLGPEFESDRGEASLGLGAGIELPVFDDNLGAIAAAVIRREDARETLEARIMEQVHLEAQARAEAQSRQDILRSYRAGALQGAGEARKSLDLRLQAGQSNILEVLAALRSLTAVRVRELELQGDTATARFAAAAAAGTALAGPANTDNEKEKK